jgi:hypothetical protein
MLSPFFSVSKQNKKFEAVADCHFGILSVYLLKSRGRGFWQNISAFNTGIYGK